MLRVSDEYDVLRSLQKRSCEQTLVKNGDRYVDHHVCKDGDAVHFDVTDLFPRN